MPQKRDDNLSLDALLHPANAFAHPSEVLKDPDLTINEKRAILASWASDACAVESAPDLRAARQDAPVRFDDIMDALRTLDKHVNGDSHRRKLRRRRIFRKDDADGPANSGAFLQ